MPKFGSVVEPATQAQERPLMATKVTSEEWDDILSRWREERLMWQMNHPIEVWRRNRNLTKEEVASILGVTISQLRAWTLQDAFPSQERLARIAETLSMTEEELQRYWTRWADSKPLLGEDGR